MMRHLNFSAAAVLPLLLFLSLSLQAITVTPPCPPGGSVWTSRTAAEANQWLSVTYGNGLFVAVAQTGTNRVMTSPDGITWTARTAADATWNSVTYGNGLFVAVANIGTNRVMTSPDGITWTARIAPVNVWWDVVYGNGRFVAVGSDGFTQNCVMTSTDGINWTSNWPGQGGWQSVTYANGLFVAVANIGTNRVMTSPDGINWTLRTAPGAAQWRSVTHGNSTFVAVADGGQVMSSSDGITWTARTPPEPNFWLSVTHANGIFVAVAASGTNRVMTSPDGETWTARMAAQANSWTSVTYGNGLFVAVSVTGTNRVMTSGTPAIVSIVSDDADNNITAGTSVTFTATPINGGATPTYQWKKNNTNVGTDSDTYTDNALADGDVITVEMTSSDPCASPATATSDAITMTVTTPCPPGGETWTARTAAEANEWNSVTYGNGLFVAVSGSGTNQVMTSSDGITWTARTAAEANYWTSVTYGNGLFVAVASSGTNRVMTSPDGITWTAHPAAAESSWLSITYGNGLFVAIANSGTHRVMTSTNGITWTVQTAASSSSWQSVTFGNGLFVAVSQDGLNQVMTSPDGINWTARTTPGFVNWRSVTYGNNLFVAVGSSGTNRVMTSPDGINWTPQTAAGANLWWSVTYGNGLFVAVAAFGTNQVMTSPDGANWTARTAAEANAWFSVTYGNNLFVAVAFDGNGTNRVMTSGVTPSVSISANPGNSITAGTPVTFTATPTNGGATPSYQWKKNNTNVGTDSPTYMDNALADGDVITVEMTSSDPCASPATATSDAITMTVTNPCISAALPMFSGLGATYCDLDAPITLTGNLPGSDAYFDGPGITNHGDGTATFTPADAIGSGTVRYLSTAIDCPEWMAATAGLDHSVALKRDGTLWAWGDNTYGQLGNGTNADEQIPVQIGTDNDWAAIAAGIYHTVAIKTNGTLWAWGSGSSGELGNGTFTNSNIPVQIGTDNNWVSIRSKGYFTIALKSNGTLWAWGYNFDGQLGNGTNINSAVPVQVGTDTDWGAIAAGFRHTVAIKTNGTLWAWGANFFGQTGINWANTPTQIGSDTDWDKIFAGTEQSYAIKTNGTLWAWGANFLGQLGIGNNTSTNTPNQVGSDTDWETMVASNACLALKSNGALWAWGSNDYGQLGNGTNTSTNTPAQIGTATDWTAIGTGIWHSLAVNSGGFLFTTGWNNGAQLGNATVVSKNQFGKVVSAFASSQVTVDICLAFDGLDPVYCSGDEPATLTGNHAPEGTFSGPGITDNGNGTATFDPAAAGTGGTVTYEYYAGLPWKKVSAGYYHIMGIKADGTLWGWGYEYNGSIGNSTTDHSNVPIQVGTDTDWADVSAGAYHSLGVKTDGTLWAWGNNGAGQLGIGNTTNQDIPVQVGAATDWAYVEAGDGRSFGIKTDGSLWAWGANGGVPGPGSNPAALTPVQIGTETNWAGVSTFTYRGHALAIKTDGTLWAWGYNDSGQLGTGNNNDSNVPVQVGTDTDWQKADAGYKASLAIKTDGTLWAWGENGDGQLGNGSTSDSNIPVLIGNGWADVAAGYEYSLGVKTDGTLWGWGYNGDGNLGNGTEDDSNVPVQSGTATNWSKVYASVDEYFSFALNKDGNLFGFGGNGDGYLGDGTYTDSSTPVPVQVDEPSAFASIDQTVTVNPGPYAIAMANMSAADCQNTTCTSDDTFTADITVTYNSKPNSGTLSLTGPTVVGTVTPVDVAGIGATSYTFTGVTLLADGNDIELTATFSEGCAKTEESAGVAPECGINDCAITNITLANAGACNDNATTDDSDDYFTTDVTVTFAYAPEFQTLVLTDAEGNDLAFKDAGDDLLCATTWTFTGVQLPANGQAVVLTARFSDENARPGAQAAGRASDEGCTYTSGTLMTAPQPCSCQPTAVFTTCPTNQTVVAAAGTCTKAVEYMTAADGLPAPTYAYAFTGATTGAGAGSGSGSVFQKGITQVSITATNACGMATCNFSVTVEDIPADITYSPSYCMKDPGPVIGLGSTLNGTIYQLKDNGGNDIGAPRTGTGAPLSFGSYPNGTYKVVSTSGSCTNEATAIVNGVGADCTIGVPNFCACNEAGGYAPVTVKISAPTGQSWTVKAVIGLYTAGLPHTPIAIGAPLQDVGGNMHTLDAARSTTKGYWVQVTNGFTDLDIRVGNPEW